ncbi:ABC transporter permease [Frankia sp. Cppng1_Ct_nod]|uniref:ABC transporter permease n=1 Tax=Frankia sp. Cppng1_Ct_nod TaxID=2897162 RepID=UPI001584A86D|nr:ABC transporter permease [Frankia sp. Cppng1_Ct_nod]
MLRYLGRRALLALGVLWAAYTVSFAILHLLPSDPVEIMAAGGDRIAPDPDRVAALRHEYGFDRSVAAQYADQLVGVLRGDLGRSVQSGQQVTTMIADAFPPTLALTAAALGLGILLGTGLAVWGTYTRRWWLRQMLLALPAVGVCLPSFFVGLVLLQVVSFRWGLLPAVGDHGVRSLLLPAVTLALPCGALIAQVLARSLTTALGEPYIGTARAKGAGPARIHLRHALRNAGLPAMTLAGVLAGNTVASAVVVETVFSRPGIGRIIVAAVRYQDIPVVQGVVLLGAVTFVVINLAVDLLYPLLDPRIVPVPTRVRMEGTV